MWTLRLEDISRAKDQLIERRHKLEAEHGLELKSLQSRHAEELKAVDAELAEIATIERAFRAFALKYQPNTEGQSSQSGVAATTPASVMKGSRNWGSEFFTPASSDASD